MSVCSQFKQAACMGPAVGAPKNRSPGRSAERLEAKHDEAGQQGEVRKAFHSPQQAGGARGQAAAGLDLRPEGKRRGMRSGV